METWDAITSRRNVRSFADRPIPPADLDRILEAGRRAPSSQNWQPWDFVLVTDRQQLGELAKVFAIPFMIDTLPPPLPGSETVAARAPPVLRDPNAAPPTTRESAPRQATIGLIRSRNVAVCRDR